ncbi:DUF6079 family protein [Candidatus Parabeggiatoa sp. HSG14]|uniref:DUF6079 family protein n=1 Tax=Candidatus Parabeggiatoa sp. HSG14 TaxID=3055593 RepID=UPI0025A6B3D5|nr:DUF6079 family protein [Thiotrichales bacterium HSG14]
MQYAELIQLKSLETVIEVRDANEPAKAKQLVSTYVISNEMADRLINLIFVQLQFDRLTDNKGLLIVGNYGTGKSHLMAMISSIAENATLVNELDHTKVAEAAQSIAGKFHVVRTEIGATTMSLRDILTQELENTLNQIGVHFQFPPANRITNNKHAFENMMFAFEARYPEHGLLLVVDELLEYLRARNDQELILDLNFLREIGEVCKDLRFRFIAGLQETIFDNQRFEFVSNALRRVKDRFEQVLITRRDIKFVVAKRLLKKVDHQKPKIEHYLQQFAVCYGNMNERMAEFCALFPVHPDFIDTFERITVIEKREILKTIEKGVQALAHKEVPKTHPGLLAYDSYWKILQENPSFRAIPEVREVIECSQVLETRIESAFTRPAYKALAIRIIHALSVHRLTTHDISAPVGVTAQELRDSLCLYQEGIDELGGNPADDLLSLVETVLREILKTVNRQFISTNAENGQYYIDFKKNYDFDAIIEKRAESLDIYQLDRHYYAALRQIMEVSDMPSGWSHSFSWTYELEWRSHRITRQGYLIFGIPTRSTAALSTTRDNNFLLYFLPLYSAFNFQLSAFSAKNELFFRLNKTDEKFDQLLRLYTASADLVSSSSGHAKSVYESKSQTYLREVLQWLQEQKATAFEVTYQGQSHKLIEWLEEVKHKDYRVTSDPALFNPHPSLLDNFRDLIELVADSCLDRYFSEIAPEYPIFSILVSHENLTQIAQETLRSIISPNRSKQARGILAALGLLTGEQIAPARSKYAQAIIEQLRQKPTGQVLNRLELLPENYFAPDIYRLEPELVIILIATLVYAGELVLVMPKQQFNTTNFAALTSTSIKDLLEFRHLERPKAFNLSALKALFELLTLPSGLDIALTNNEEVAVQQLQTKVSETLNQLVQAQQILTTGCLFWGKPILNQTDMQHYWESLAQIKSFLETLQAYSTPLKFKNFRYNAEEVIAHKNSLILLQDINHLQTMLTILNPTITYLTAAESALSPQHAWLLEVNQVRDDLLAKLNDIQQRNSSGFSYHIQQQLNILQNNYIIAYLALHQQARLRESEEKTKQVLLNDNRLKNLKKLVKIAFLPRQQLNEFENSLNRLQTCYALTENDLIAHTICPYCGYQPISESQTATPIVRLARLDQILEQLYTEWTQTLLAELENAETQRELLKPENSKQLDTFLKHRTLPENITQTFIEAVQESLSELIKVTVSMADLQNALLAGGSPVTAIEIQKRFINYLNGLTKNKELNKVRIVLE